MVLNRVLVLIGGLTLQLSLSKGNRSKGLLLIVCTAVALTALTRCSVSAAEPSQNGAGEPLIIDSVRFYPVPGHEAEMVGGRFVGYNDEHETPRELARIEATPSSAIWNEIKFENTEPYRFVRYEGPSDSFCRVAELEFLAGKTRLHGDGFDSAPIGDKVAPWHKAFDGKVDTFAEFSAAGNQFVGLDLVQFSACKPPVMQPKPGIFESSPAVSMSTATPGASIMYTLDGSIPSKKHGIKYESPISIPSRACIQSIAIRNGTASSAMVVGVFQVGKPEIVLNTFHMGNSLTNTTSSLPLYASTLGIQDIYRAFLRGGATTKVLWDLAEGERKEEFEKSLKSFERIDHFTLQPRDFHVDQEADSDLKFLDVVRKHSPKMQPWLYAEWVEFQRQRPTDTGKQASPQMLKVWPSLTWEESMSAMLLYVEDLRLKLGELDKQHEPPRIIPSCLAMGWMRNMIDNGKVPGMEKGSFYEHLYRDGVHPNAEGGFLVDMTWISAFTGRPVKDALPLGTRLTLEQARIMQKLASDVVTNYPFSGCFKEGNKKVEPAQFRVVKTQGDIATLALLSKTSGAWFRYTLDGSEPSRMHGYVYCGAVSYRPGMKLQAIAYKSGMADSQVSAY
jgi:hypothetical protein